MELQFNQNDDSRYWKNVNRQLFKKHSLKIIWMLYTRTTDEILIKTESVNWIFFTVIQYFNLLWFLLFKSNSSAAKTRTFLQVWVMAFLLGSKFMNIKSFTRQWLSQVLEFIIFKLPPFFFSLPKSLQKTVQFKNSSHHFYSFNRCLPFTFSLVRNLLGQEYHQRFYMYR